MLSHFSCVQLSVTPSTAAHQVLLSMGFSSKNTEWVAMPFSRTKYHGTFQNSKQSSLILLKNTFQGTLLVRKKTSEDWFNFSHIKILYSQT